MVYLNDDIEHFDWQAALPLLSEQRREQCLRFKHEQGRKTCAAAYLLLCEALRKEYGIEEPPIFEYGDHGKPSLVGLPHIHFNLSHCRVAAICVVSDKPVGVDIEAVVAVEGGLDKREGMTVPEKLLQKFGAALRFLRPGRVVLLAEGLRPALQVQRHVLVESAVRFGFLHYFKHVHRGSPSGK